MQVFWEGYILEVFLLSFPSELNLLWVSSRTGTAEHESDVPLSSITQFHRVILDLFPSFNSLLIYFVKKQTRALLVGDLLFCRHLSQRITCCSTVVALRWLNADAASGSSFQQQSWLSRSGWYSEDILTCVAISLWASAVSYFRADIQGSRTLCLTSYSHM